MCYLNKFTHELQYKRFRILRGSVKLFDSYSSYFHRPEGHHNLKNVLLIMTYKSGKDFTKYMRTCYH